MAVTACFMRSKNYLAQVKTVKTPLNGPKQSLNHLFKPMQDLIKHLPAVIYEYTVCPDGKKTFTYISPAVESILGLKPEDVLQDESVINSIVHPEDFQSLEKSSQDSQYNEVEWNWQGRMIVRGHIRVMEIRSNHERKEDGAIIRRGLIQDITERTDLARETEARYQSLVERLPIGIIIHIRGKLVFANAQAHHILGTKVKTDIIGAEIINFVHPDHRGLIYERMKKVLSGEATPMIEQKYVRQDGREIDVEAIAFPFTYKGEPAIQVIFRDITDRKVAEERMKKNETLFTQLFQNVPMAVVMLDESGKVQEINKGFKEMFGFELEELRGKNLNDHIVPEELRNEGIDLNNLVASSRVISVETIRRHKNGNPVNVILYGMPVMHDNETIGIYGVYVDISDRKKVEEELKIRNAELDNFVYKVSHDLRAPLSSILGLVNLASLPGNTDDPMDYIGLIGTKVEHLDHFIGDVLSHSKNLKMEVTTSRVDLKQIIERTFTDLNYLEGARTMRRIVKLEGIDFYSDPWRIAEIFRNLISKDRKSVV